MDKQVIHIYGASGSGTSAIGRYISEKLGYFFMDTDDYFIGRKLACRKKL